MRRLIYILLISLLLLDVGCAGDGDFESVPEEDIGTSPDVGLGEDDESNPPAPPPQNLPFPEPCDVFSQDCPDFDGRETSCVPSGFDGIPRCIVLAERREVGELCEGNHQCVAGSACIIGGHETSARCTWLCDAHRLEEGCLDDELCTGGLPVTEDIGYCRDAPIPCDIYAQDCEDGLACVLQRHPVTNERGTYCGRAGDSGPGEACAEAGGPCQAGLICLRDGEDTPTCHRVCSGDEECSGGAECKGQTSDLQIDYCRS